MGMASFEVYIGEIGIGKMGTTKQHPSNLNFAKLFDSLDRNVESGYNSFILSIISPLFYYFLTCTSLWAKSADGKFVICFLGFPWKQDFIFHVNCLHWRQFAWNVKILFPGKNERNISNCRLILPRVLSIKEPHFFYWQGYFCIPFWHKVTS